MEGVISASLAAVRQRIQAAAREAGRAPHSVTLVAVSKTHPAASVREALLAGHRTFGENRVQEALAKYPQLRAEFRDLALHLIGPLQTNKSRDAVAAFDVIETVDRPRLAQALATEMDPWAAERESLSDVILASRILELIRTFQTGAALSKIPAKKAQGQLKCHKAPRPPRRRRIRTGSPFAGLNGVG